MKKNLRLARQMGLLRIPDDKLVDIAEVSDLDPARTCVICTGSQGEPLSALSLMAAGENRWVKMRLTNAGLRLIDKKGLDVVLAEMRARGEKV